MDPISVIIPAHNEAAVIGRCLTTILDGAEPGELDVIVVPNGCTDDTAEIAGGFPGVRVVDCPTASKAAALNVGDEAASTFPRLYVDADVDIGADDVRAVADVLRGSDIEVAAPRMEVDLAGRPWSVRAYYAVWTSLPYHQEDMVGSGVFALSATGRSRFERFPEDRLLFADDRFIRTLAPRARRRSVDSARFTIHPPFSLRSLIRIRRRMYMANMLAERSGAGEDDDEPRRQRAALVGHLRDPRRWPELAVYVTVVVAAKAGARRRIGRNATSTWDRDDSARSAAGRS